MLEDPHDCCGAWGVESALHRSLDAAKRESEMQGDPK
ncbi:hypothetical protein THIOKS11310038 [Thiocapsa sp. KS1]|nr:hypothetical protein THIOKS11310038 [Thiocapsa sp. KS1]